MFGSNNASILLHVSFFLLKKSCLYLVFPCTCNLCIEYLICIWIWFCGSVCHRSLRQVIDTKKIFLLFYLLCVLEIQCMKIFTGKVKINAVILRLLVIYEDLLSAVYFEPIWY